MDESTVKYVYDKVVKFSEKETLDPIGYDTLDYFSVHFVLKWLEIEGFIPSKQALELNLYAKTNGNTRRQDKEM